MAQRRRVERRPRARLDIIEQAIYLAEEATEEVAFRFIDAVDAAARRLAETPEIGRLREFRSAHLDGLRSWPVPGFPNHLIFYRVADDSVEMVRIIHGARDLALALEEDE